MNKEEEFIKQNRNYREKWSGMYEIERVIYLMEKYAQQIAIEFADYYFVNRGVLSGNTAEIFDEWINQKQSD